MMATFTMARRSSPCYSAEATGEFESLEHRVDPDAAPRNGLAPGVPVSLGEDVVKAEADSVGEVPGLHHRERVDAGLHYFGTRTAKDDIAHSPPRGPITIFSLDWERGV